MEPIKQSRFNALAGYAKRHGTRQHFKEVGWFQKEKERFLITIAQDQTDKDYVAGIFSKDKSKKYKLIDQTKFFETEKETIKEAERITKTIDAKKIINELYKKTEPIDFFESSYRKGKSPNENFKTLEGCHGYQPAKEIIQSMMQWHQDVDGNFIEQFQTNGFDARLWELYLFATLKELEYEIDNSQQAPDFLARGVLGKFFIEATTINPSNKKNESTENSPGNRIIRKFRRALTNKLSKRYWEMSHVQGNSLVIAINDFHDPDFNSFSENYLQECLYGKENITEGKIKKNYPDPEAPFFYLPDSRHISAVITNPSATIAKFNRIGFLSGFGPNDITMTRIGACHNHNPDSTMPHLFSYELDPKIHNESWIEGMSVYHNPNAETPLNPATLPGAAHHFVDHEGMYSQIPQWFPRFSKTLIHRRAPDHEA